MHLSNMQLWVSLKTDIFLCVHDCAFGVQVYVCGTSTSALSPKNGITFIFDVIVIATQIKAGFTGIVISLDDQIIVSDYRRHRCPHHPQSVINKASGPCTLSEYANKYITHPIEMRKSMKPDHKPAATDGNLSDKTTHRFVLRQTAL